MREISLIYCFSDLATSLLPVKTENLKRVQARRKILNYELAVSSLIL